MNSQLTLKIKHQRLHQFNTGEYQRLAGLKIEYLKEGTALDMLEQIVVLDLSRQHAKKLPPLNTIEYYFPKLHTLNLSNNHIKSLDAKSLIKACPLLTSLDISFNQISEMKQILKLDGLQGLRSLSAKGNPISLIKKRISLIECLIMGGGGIYKQDVTEKLIYDYLTAGYTHVPREEQRRPFSAFGSPQRKLDSSSSSVSESRVFPNCMDEKYQIKVMKYVSLEEKEMEAILKMTSVTPRQGGNFKRLELINGEQITVKELSDILYYDRYPKDFERNKELHRQLASLAQLEYKNSALKKGAKHSKTSVELLRLKKEEQARPVTGRKVLSREREANKEGGGEVDRRPKTVIRLDLNNQKLAKQMEEAQKQPAWNQKKAVCPAKEKAPFDIEKERIREDQKFMRKDFKYAKEKVGRMKEEFQIKTFRYNEVSKAPTFYPQTPQIPTIQIKGKNLGKELMNDIFAEKQVQYPDNKGKKKLMKRIFSQQQLKNQEQNIMEMSFESEQLNEKLDEEVMKLNEVSSHEEEDEDFLPNDDLDSP